MQKAVLTFEGLLKHSIDTKLGFFSDFQMSSDNCDQLVVMNEMVLKY